MYWYENVIDHNHENGQEWYHRKIDFKYISNLGSLSCQQQLSSHYH